MTERRMARRYIKHERQANTLQSTGLVHEVYLRLVDVRGVEWRERAQFYAMAAQMMRRILVDHALTRIRAKRGGRLTKVLLDEIAVVSMNKAAELIMLDDALTGLAEIDPQKSRIVEMKIFCGLSTEEIAEVQKVSPRTIRREWVHLSCVRQGSCAKSGREDLNLRPHGPEPCALAMLSYAPFLAITKALASYRTRLGCQLRNVDESATGAAGSPRFSSRGVRSLLINLSQSCSVASTSPPKASRKAARIRSSRSAGFSPGARRRSRKVIKPSGCVFRRV